jgi:iron complex outermembrane receptor protein
MKKNPRRFSRTFPVIVAMAGFALPCEHLMAQEQITPAAAAGTSEAADSAAVAAAKAKEASNSMPMTTQVISRGALDAQNPSDTYEALKNVAGVTNSNSKGTIADNINIRGIPLSFSTSYRLNGGLPIANISTIPTEDKERIEALKGANALMFGVASPAGIVNLVTKRATAADVTTATFTGNSFGMVGASADLGRKFGDEKQFGIRINAAHAHLETGVDGGSGESDFGSLALDWKATSQLGFKLDVESYRRHVVEQGQLSQLKPVNGVITIPNVPDPSKLLSGPFAVYRPTTTNIMLHSDYALSNSWVAVAEVGRSTSDRSRVIGRISNYNTVTGAGTEGFTLVNTSYKNTYAKLETLGKFDTGPLGHKLTFGVMRNERDASVPSTTTVSVAQNIYNPVAISSVGLIAPTSFLQQVSKDTGVYAYDSIAVGSKWQFLAGVRETFYEADNQLPTGGQAVTKSKTASPAAGLVYTIVPSTSLYLSYMKGLEETGIAPSGTTNQFSILPAAAATQSEFGMRTAFSGVSANVAYFSIDRANTVIDATSNTFLIDGTTSYKGVEATLSADISSSWTVSTAGQFMHAVQNSVIDKSINGLQPESTPKVSGNVSATYRAAAVPGLTLTTGALYTGPRAINPQNQAFIPGVTLISMGAGYATKIRGHGVNFQFNVDNLTNKQYWGSAGSGAFAVGTQRGFRMNARVDL